MNSDSMLLSFGEKVGMELGSLYRSFGYIPYKMNKFEEYDLYANHKDFLGTDRVLTFTDAGGKLMALKPDVTLSIVRNTRDDLSGVRKVYYTENVYRAGKGSSTFKEILQSGVECIGEIDDYLISETLILAAQSLQKISPDYSLVISHLGILSAALTRLGVPEVCCGKILRLISEKNLHELATVCTEWGADATEVQALMQLLKTDGSAEDVLSTLDALGCAPAAVQQLRTVYSAMKSVGFDRQLRIDPAIVSDMNYYNGIVFKGFVDGVPLSVLSGGQYDRLMEKMGRCSRAIGFAVYLDALERLGNASPDYDVDVVLLYDDGTDLRTLCNAVQNLSFCGLRVSAQKCRPEKLKFRQLAALEGNEVVLLE